MIDDKVLLNRAVEYAKSRGILLPGQVCLGHGTDGAVWRTDRPSAIKAIHYARVYRMELRCYLRLKERGISNLCGFAVPVLEDWDDELQVIEISIVQPPICWTSARSTWTIRLTTFLTNSSAKARMPNGESGSADNGLASIALRALQSHGIFYIDPRPSNIALEDEPDDDDWSDEGRFYEMDEP